MNTKRINLKNLRQVLELVERYKLDSLEIDGCKLSKSRHLFSAGDLKAANTVPQASPQYFEPTTLAELDADAEKLLGIKR